MAIYHMEGWRRMAILSAYRESIPSSLSDQEGLQQVKKTNCFLMLAKNTLTKHFRRWVQELLFLSLFSEAPTARIFVRYLLDLPDQPNQENMFFESTIHNKIINLSALRKWLEPECGCKERQNILASPRFTKH
jgi:hypothetical protein